MTEPQTSKVRPSQSLFSNSNLAEKKERQQPHTKWVWSKDTTVISTSAEFHHERKMDFIFQAPL